MQVQKLPGASDALTFGILSIVLTLLCCGPFGAIFGFIGLSKAKSAEKIYEAQPNDYQYSDNIKTGRTLSYIGIALAAIMLVLTIIYIGAVVAFILAVSNGSFD